MTQPVPVTLQSAHQKWPLREAFRISRGAKTSADVVIVHASAGSDTGRGECVPYARYGETVKSVQETIANAAAASHTTGTSLTRTWLLQHMPAGAARSAIDCALWDLEAKRSATGVTLTPPHGDAPGRQKPLVTCLTVSLNTPEVMAQAAARLAPHPLLKLKLGDGDTGADIARMEATRAARPDASIVVDANEGWAPADLSELIATAARCNIELIEQPLPAGNDGALAHVAHDVPICADEALPPGGTIAPLRGRYDAINVKLDKAGGLTAALKLMEEASTLAMPVMVGSMVATSLSMAPAYHLARACDARWIDLDSPALLAADRSGAMSVSPDGILTPPTPALWG